MSLTTDTTMQVVPAYNYGGGMFGGGDNAWWVILFLLAGGRGFGWGGQGGGSFCNYPCATQADVRAAVDQQTLISKLDQQTYGLADATYALNNTVTSGFANAELSRCNQQAALMAYLNAMAMNDQKCCCETLRLIERGFADTNYNLANQFCEIRHQSEKNTRDIIDNNNGNTRAILEFLTKDKIDTLTAENQSLKQAAFFTANQEAQTAEIMRRLGRDY